MTRGFRMTAAELAEALPRGFVESARSPSARVKALADPGTDIL